jgi:hypothetical protein
MDGRQRAQRPVNNTIHRAKPGVYYLRRQEAHQPMINTRNLAAWVNAGNPTSWTTREDAARYLTRFGQYVDSHLLGRHGASAHPVPPVAELAALQRPGASAHPVSPVAQLAALQRPGASAHPVSPAAMEEPALQQPQQV